MSKGMNLAPIGPSADPHNWLQGAIDALPAEQVRGKEVAGLDTKRKLATVRRIGKKQHFSNDLDLNTVDGWVVLTKKTHNFQTGKYVLFIEVDAFLPSGGQFSNIFAEVGPLVEFDGKKGYRVGTKSVTNKVKHRVISQGHVFKLSNFPHIEARHKFQNLARQQSGAPRDLDHVDYTEYLGILKWSQSTPESNATADNRRFPPFIPKTDISRVEDCPNLFSKNKYKHMVFQESIKMDGSSMTCYFVPKTPKYFKMLGPATDDKHASHSNGRFGVCSKNRELGNKSKNLYWDAALIANLHIKLHQLGRSIALQGELVGSKINNNPHGYAKGEHEFIFYSAFDIDTQSRCDPQQVELLAKELGIKHVEVLGYVILHNIASCHQDIIDRAEKRKGEGLVFKNIKDSRWFKVLSRSYIVERGDEAQAQKAEKAAKACKGGPGMCPTAPAFEAKVPAAKASPALRPVAPVFAAPAPAPLPAASDSEVPGPPLGPTGPAIETPTPALRPTALAFGAPASVVVEAAERHLDLLRSLDQTAIAAPMVRKIPATPKEYALKWLLTKSTSWQPLADRIHVAQKKGQAGHVLTSPEIEAIAGEQGVFTMMTSGEDLAAKVEKWRLASEARILHPDDGALGTVVAKWAAKVWGESAPDVNDVYAKVQEVKFGFTKALDFTNRINGLSELLDETTMIEQLEIMALQEEVVDELSSMPGWDVMRGNATLVA